MMVAGIAALVQDLSLIHIYLEAASKQPREEIDKGTGQRKARALKRLKVVNAFLTTGNKPDVYKRQQ